MLRKNHADWFSMASIHNILSPSLPWKQLWQQMQEPGLCLVRCQQNIQKAESKNSDFYHGKKIADVCMGVTSSAHVKSILLVGCFFFSPLLQFNTLSFFRNIDPCNNTYMSLDSIALAVSIFFVVWLTFTNTESDKHAFLAMCCRGYS